MNRYACLLVVAIVLSCQNDKTEKSSTATTTTASADYSKIDSTRGDPEVAMMINRQKDVIAPFVNEFNAKDIFFLLVQRRFEKDTLPPIITENYSREEILMTRRKIEPIRSLTNEQLLALYQATSRNKVIYGRDDRKPVFYDISRADVPTGDEYLDDAKSVVAIIDKQNMRRDAAGNYVIQPRGTFKKEYNLCDSERFAEEPVTAHCSGFAASANKIVTADHCVQPQYIRAYYFVFDYLADANGKYATTIPADRVYEAVEYIQGSVNHPNTDFAVIRVNRPIPAYRIARVNPNVSYGNGDLYHVIGCPCGIPLKLAPKAALRTYTDPNFFVINSDTYGGNSGSPVFNSTNHMVEGILVRGEDDFSLEAGRCRISFLCPFDGCRGEDVSKNGQFINYIN